MGVLKINNKLFKFNNHLCIFGSSPGPEPVFPYVQIGNQIWMAENLQINDGGEGIYQTNQISQDLPIPMTYYTVDAARRIASNINGWHLPTKTEMETLITEVGGIDVVGLKLKSTNYWYEDYGGEDSYGFCVYPCGYAEYDGSMNLYNTTTDSYLITDTDSPYDSNQVYSLWFQFYNESGNIENQVGGYGSYHTVRLIKDSE